jgi:hypothetical protein
LQKKKEKAMFEELIEDVKSDFRELYIWVHNYLVYRRQSFKMGLAIRLADIKQKAFNRQFHVMVLSLPKGEKLVSVSRDDILRFKRKKWLPKRLGRLELESSIFYSTPANRNNSFSHKARKAAKDKYLKYSKYKLIR